jgi:hypothetical protein
MINIFISESCGSNGFKCPKSICFWAYTALASSICRFGKWWIARWTALTRPRRKPRKCSWVLQMWMLCCNANSIGKQMLYTNTTALHNPSPLFPQLVLDWWKCSIWPCIYREDFLVLNNIRNNENFAMLLTDNTYSGNMEG